MTLQHPFGLILYYLFCFTIMVILLNILIALYNSAYEDITDNADDEYMALYAQKTMQFVRAPDENVFIAPFNLIELFLLIIPLEWWMPTEKYARLNDYIMGIIYSPLLLVTAAMETASAHTVRKNKKRRGSDEDNDEDDLEEWEAFEEVGVGEEWAKKVEATKPNVEIDSATAECRKLKGEVEELKKMVRELLEMGKGGTENGGS